MYQSRVKCIVIFLITLWGYESTAQTGTTSNPTNGRVNNPYSKYGIGELINGNSTVLRGMGNVTSAFENPYEVNSDNPASYSFLQRTTFEIGATGETRSVVGSGLTYRTGTASVSYLNLGIPVGKNAGICLGFRPYSHTFYDMADSQAATPIGLVEKRYNGEGGLNYVYLGGAAKHKGLSIGFNAGYMFGTIRNTAGVMAIDTQVINRAYTTEYTNYTQIGGIYWKGGIMYERKIDSDYTFRIGGTFTLSQKLTEHLNEYQISTYNFGDTLVNDTTVKNENQKGKLTLPMSYSIGVMIARNDKWNLGLDYTATQWSNFASTPDSHLTEQVGSGSYKISLGGELTPDMNNIRNYWSRVTYRMGLYYGTDYLKINNTALPFYGLTLGGSLPFRKSLSKLHMSMDIGRLGNTSNGLIQQTYFKFTLGVSFNDKWFIPRKYD